MEIVRTKQALYDYLIEPSPLFLKQVVDIAETKAYLLVMDSREMKKRAIPDAVIAHFESRFQHLCQHSCHCQDYDGVNYLLIPKI